MSTALYINKFNLSDFDTPDTYHKKDNQGILMWSSIFNTFFTITILIYYGR